MLLASGILGIVGIVAPQAPALAMGTDNDSLATDQKVVNHFAATGIKR